jgi:hypothetical protein
VRASLSLVSLLALAAAAAGQLPGKKIIPGHRTVVLEKELPGYAFYTVREEKGRPRPDPDQPPEPVYRATPVKLVPGVPQVVDDTLPLYVVPESDASANQDPLELGQQLAHALIPGAHSVTYAGGIEVKDSDPRTRNEIRVVIKSVDPDAGLIYDRFSNDPDDPRNFTDAQGNPLPGAGAGGGEKPQEGTRWGVIILALVGVGALVGGIVWVVLSRRNRDDDDED